MDRVRIGEVFQNKYLILAELGSGGMGTVYKARQLDVDREVALKLLSAGKILGDDAVARFYREFKLLSQLAHPNIVTFYGMALDADSCPFAIFELVNGTTLRTLLLQEGALPWQRATKIVLQLCSALQYAHDHGVIHRDLKPENIMLVEQPSLDFVKVLDFGLSRLISPDPDSEVKLSWTGQLIGSPRYMSPEQFSGKADQRSDIYALGCLFFELLTAELLFEADTAAATIWQHCNVDALTRIESISSKLPSKLFGVLSHLLAKNPDDRFQTMTSVAADLKAILDLPEVLMTGVEWSHRKNAAHPKPSAFIISALLVLLIVSSVVAIQKQAKPKGGSVSSTLSANLDVSTLLNEIRRAESRGDFEEAFPIYERSLDLLSNDTKRKELRLDVLKQAIHCAREITDKQSSPTISRRVLQYVNEAIPATLEAGDYNSYADFIGARYKILTDLSDEKEILNTARDVVRQVDKHWTDPNIRITARKGSSGCLMQLHKWKEAETVALEAVALSKQPQVSCWNLTLARAMLARAESHLGKVAEARENLRECSRLLVSCRDEAGASRSSFIADLVPDYSRTGFLDSFKILLQKELECNLDLYQGQTGLAASLLMRLAKEYSQKESTVDAIALYKQAMQFAEQDSDKTNYRSCLSSLADLYKVMGDKKSADECQAKLKK